MKIEAFLDNGQFKMPTGIQFLQIKLIQLTIKNYGTNI